MVWKRPSFWTCIIAIIVYWDWRALNGNYVYDDAGSVVRNVVVTGSVPWTEAFTRDFWGQEMKEAASHKSFRPITTLSLKLNYLYETSRPAFIASGEKYPPTFSFHLVNVLLHGLVTGIITEATWYVLPDVVSQLIVGGLFGVHPVHAEVVSNITSRGELLMSFFFGIAFLSFAYSLTQAVKRENPADAQPQGSRLMRFLGIYVVPWLCMTLSLFSKEQGATTLITLVIWDFLNHHGNLLNFWSKLRANESSAIRFVGRTFVLAAETLIVVAWRYHLNGETSPDFIEAQNPAGFAKDRFTRAFSVSWVYCLYIRDALYPFYLCPDWSGISLELIKTFSDPRAMIVMCLWYGAAMSFWSLIVGQGRHPPSEGTNSRTFFRNDSLLRKVNMGIWAFCFSPFLLSSNILVVVGLMKADRVIYLPLFGFLIIEAALLQHFFLKGKVSMPTAFDTKRRRMFWTAHFFFMFQCLVCCGRTHERNLAWSDSLSLWGSAYKINQRSTHLRYNYGYELSLKGRFQEAEEVLRPIGNPRVDGPTNTFVYAMVLFNLDQCDRANTLLDEAFIVIQEKRRDGGVRNTESSLSRTESNLLVARAHCVEDIQEKGRILYEAVQTDPSNEYAVGLASQMMEKLQRYEELKRELAQGGSIRE
jgi:protein O-mannosyl-transferase